MAGPAGASLPILLGFRVLVDGERTVDAESALDPSEGANETAATAGKGGEDYRRAARRAKC